MPLDVATCIRLFLVDLAFSHTHTRDTHQNQNQKKKEERRMKEEIIRRKMKEEEEEEEK